MNSGSVESRPALWRCLAAGAAAGFVNGFFGAGGGMVLVPLLIILVRLEDKAAFSSAVCIILPICIVSLIFYGMYGALPIEKSVPYLIGGGLGGILSGLLFQKVSARFLHIALGALILFGGVRLLFC